MYKLVTEGSELIRIANVLLEANAIIAIDTETTGLFIKEDYAAGFSFSWKAGCAVYVPVNHKVGPNCDFVSTQKFFDIIKPLRVVFHNALFDKGVIYSTFGKNIPVFADTMIYATLLGEPKGLKDLSLLHLNKRQAEFSTIMKEEFGPRWASQGFNFSDFASDSPEVLSYAGEDADNTLQLFNLFHPRMAPFKSVLKIEEGLITPVLKMNLRGAPVNVDMLNKSIIDYEKSTEDLYEEICEIAGRKISLNSPVDLGSYLFGELSLPVISRSKKTGAPSTSKDVLEELSDLHPVVSKIDTWRKDSRLLKAYLKKIPAGVDENNRIFTHFDPLGAVSGRFTSSSVTDSTGLCRGLNLQNVPRKKKRSIDMRQAFIAPEGWTFVKADYSQIEYRVMASLSGEEYMLESFKKGIDFHSFAAHMMYDIEVEDVTPEQRDMGKVFNFGLSYGMTAKGLAMRIGVSEEEAERRIELYFSRLPKLVSLINATKQRALETGFTSTFFGRTRKLPLEFVPAREQEQLLRKAFNTMIQGTAADLLKIAILRMCHNLIGSRKDIEFILTVHDEVCLLVKNEVLDEVLPELKRALEFPVPESWAPLVAEISYGKTWSEDDQEIYLDAVEKEEFTGWGNVLPAGLKTSID